MSKFNIVIATSFYVVSLIVFIFYLYEKYKKERYIFSVCNAYIFQYAVILFVITPFAFTPIAWVKLLGNAAYSTASGYYSYLLKSLTINCFGFLVFLIALQLYEFSPKKPKYIYKKLIRAKDYIMESFLNLEFIIVVMIWLVYSIMYTGGFSLFGTTSSSEGGTLYYVNQATQVIVTMMTLYYGFGYINRKKNLLYLAIGIVCCVLMGKRATLVMDILWGMVIYVLYRRATLSRKVFKRAIKYAVVLVIVALAIGNIRSSSTGFTLIQDLIYGNTFCDIRDGGLILYGFENNTNSEWAMGRTYLSALLSFIPSSFIDLRLEWDWGRYSTTALLGWKNHPGLRGGWSMEGYLNFGLLGVVISQILSAWIYASMEKCFRIEVFGSDKKHIHEKSMLSLYLFITLARRMTCSAGFFAVYVMILFIGINILIGRSRKSRFYKGGN